MQRGIMADYDDQLEQLEQDATLSDDLSVPISIVYTACIWLLKFL